VESLEGGRASACFYCARVTCDPRITLPPCSLQRHHAAALRAISQPNYRIQHAIFRQPPKLHSSFTRNPHAQHAADTGRALQFKRHNIAAGSKVSITILPTVQTSQCCRRFKGHNAT